jgi:Peptidase family M23
MNTTHTDTPASDLRRRLQRGSTPLVALGIIVVAVSVIADLGWFALAGGALIVGGLALLVLRTEQPDREPIVVRPPVRGRWIAINSPATRVPSHGTRELGQAYAIDLVHAPDPDVEWRPVHRWPPARRPESFPGFGVPIVAPADGVVAAASGWQRDHWSRNSPLGLAYLMAEMIIRALLSMLDGRFVIGNHVVLDLGDGVFAVFAHLRRGSLKVRRGDWVRAGDQLGECGNSGNTSEPHLHFHLMDRHRPVIAAGLPFSFDHYEADGEMQSGVPADKQAFVAGR